MSEDSLRERLERRLRRSRPFYWLSSVVQRAVDAPVAAGRLRGAFGPHRLDPSPPGRNGADRLDLSQQVTVFITTVGRSTFADALGALEHQDCTFAGPVVIKNVSPWPRAFQRMIDTCQTPWYVQVDEDMILKPHAIRHLYEAVAAAPPKLAVVWRPLWDSHLARAIGGLKIWRAEAMRPYRYEEGRAPSIDMFRRLEADGWRIESKQPIDYLGREVDSDPHREEILGEHRVEGTKLLYDRFYAIFSSFQQYTDMDYAWRDLATAMRRLGLDSDPYDPDLWALLGAAAGLANPRQADSHYQGGRLLPAFRQLRALVTRGPEEVGLVLSTPGRPDATVRELKRLFWLFGTIRRVRLLGEGDPLASREAPALLRFLGDQDVDVVCETLGGALTRRDVLVALRALGGRGRVVLRVAHPGLADQHSLVRAAEAARAEGLACTVSVTLTARRLADDTAGEGLQRLLRRFVELGVDVELRHPLPTTSDPDVSWREAVTVETAGAAERLDRLAASGDGVRYPRPLAAFEDGVCDSPFRGLVVDGAGSVSGCLAGVIPTRPAHGSIYDAKADEIWFERHLRELRNELSGKAPCRAECRACPFNRG